MRARLLDSALLLAASHGPANLSVDSVIASAGVSRGTFYKYFNAPADLVQELAEQVSHTLIESMYPQVQAASDPALGVALGVRTALRLVRSHPLLGAFMVRSGWPAMDKAHLFFTLVGRDLEKGIRKGRFVRMHVDVALNLLAGSVVGAMHSITSGKVPRDFPEQTAAAVLRALGLAASEAAQLCATPLPPVVIDPASVVGRLTA